MTAKPMMPEEPAQRARSHAEPAVSHTPRAALGERELIGAMRRGEAAAFREFLLRFGPLLLEHARRLGIPAAEREGYAVEVLGDAASGLAAGGVRPPRSLAAYLVTALRHRVLNAQRGRVRRERLAHAAAGEGEPAAERVVAPACSEHAIRSSRGPDWDGAPLPSALARLAVALDDRLSDSERLLLVWVSHHVPHRQIARWLDISYAAAAQRIWRLRERLRRAALEHAAGASADDRAELERFFRRAGIGGPAPISEHAPAPRPSAGGACDLHILRSEEGDTP